MESSCQQQSSLFIFSRGTTGVAGANSSSYQHHVHVLPLEQWLDLGHRSGLPLFRSQAHLRERKQRGKQRKVLFFFFSVVQCKQDMSYRHLILGLKFT